MTANALTAASSQPAMSLERLSLVLLLAFVGALQISIAAADILFAAVLLCWGARVVRERTRLEAPAFFVPLVAYGGFTLVSAAFSMDPLESLIDSRQLLLFLVVPAVYDIARGSRASTVIDVIVAVGAASAAYGIVQYAVLRFGDRGLRPEGALTHYMTYSGVLTLVICAVTARLVFATRDRLWPALVMPALIVALSLTLSRGPWVGACVGIGLLLVLKDLRLSALVPVLVAVMFALAPDSVADRMTSMFNMRDPTVRDRVAMLHTGAAIVADHPLVGVGPNMVPRVYPKYRDPDAVEAINPHLHNVPVQIAAERGLPALGVWLWFVVLLGRNLFLAFRRTPAPSLPAAGLAALATMLAAGLFEYNFGDSEFLMLFLVICTLPFAAARPDPATHSTP
jgi:O-antigen ligase